MIHFKLKLSGAACALTLALIGCEDTSPTRSQPSAARPDASVMSEPESEPATMPVPKNAEPDGSTEAADDPSTPSPMPTGASMPPPMPTDSEPREPAPDNEPTDTAPKPSPAPATDEMPKPPEWPSDCETRHAFLAHGTTPDAKKYPVPPGAQYYRVFYFARPWPSDVQILKARSLVDNHKVVHHWTLYTVNNDDVRDGEISGGPNGTFDTPNLSDSIGIYSAGPGASDLEMPDGIGLRVPETPALALEIHYFNASDSMEEDSTGVEVCVTSKKRPVEAASHQLGKVEFLLPAHQRADVTSVCRPRAQRDTIHLMAVTPHMHLAGRHYKLVLNRASGESVTLFDMPYAFEEQRSYDLPLDGSAPDVKMEPGDTLTSVCTYQNDRETAIAAGNRTEDEMCQPLVVAWPAGALTNALLPTTLFAASVIGCVEL